MHILYPERTRKYPLQEKKSYLKAWAYQFLHILITFINIYFLDNYYIILDMPMWLGLVRNFQHKSDSLRREITPELKTITFIGHPAKMVCFGKFGMTPAKMFKFNKFMQFQVKGTSWLRTLRRCQQSFPVKWTFII